MRPSKDQYFIQLANTARLRSSCTGRQVGAILVCEERVVATGYNGVASGMPHCADGGCWRCMPENRQKGHGYDVCICVHAESNALLSAARFGAAVADSTCYSTLQPCMTCAKELLQAGVRRLVYAESFEYPDDAVKKQYRKLLAEFDQREAYESIATEWLPGIAGRSSNGVMAN